MKKRGITICCAFLFVVACSKEESPPVTTTPPPVTPPVSQEQKQTDEEKIVAEPTSAQPQKPVDTAAVETKPDVTVAADEATHSMTAPVAMPSKDRLSREKVIALAKSSGCFACHNINKKIVGPAWADVAKRYQGDATSREKLIEKVKKGGKGNWTEITGGAVMPPYSPRVSDTDIKRLIDFILSLS